MTAPESVALGLAVAVLLWSLGALIDWILRLRATAKFIATGQLQEALVLYQRGFRASVAKFQDAKDPEGASADVADGSVTGLSRIQK